MAQTTTIRGQHGQVGHKISVVLEIADIGYIQLGDRNLQYQQQHTKANFSIHLIIRFKILIKRIG